MYHLAKSNRISAKENRVIITPKDLENLRILQREKMKIREQKAAKRRESYFK